MLIPESGRFPGAAGAVPLPVFILIRVGPELSFFSMLGHALNLIPPPFRKSSPSRVREAVSQLRRAAAWGRVYELLRQSQERGRHLLLAAGSAT